MSNAIQAVTEAMQAHLSLYVIICLWVAVYLLVEPLFKQLGKKQKERKKRTKERMDALKEPYREREEVRAQKEETKAKIIRFFQKYDSFAQNNPKWEAFKEAFGEIVAKNRTVEAMRFEKHLTPEEIAHIQQEARRIIREEKSHAMLPIGLFVVRLYLFIAILASFHAFQDIPYSLTFVTITTIVSFFAMVTRKTVFLFLVLAIISFFVYQLFTGASLFFILVYSLAKGCLFRWKQWKRRRLSDATEPDAP